MVFRDTSLSPTLLPMKILFSKEESIFIGESDQ